jgi:hypothetical protein
VYLLNHAYETEVILIRVFQERMQEISKYDTLELKICLIWVLYSLNSVTQQTMKLIKSNLLHLEIQGTKNLHRKSTVNDDDDVDDDDDDNNKYYYYTIHDGGNACKAFIINRC